MTDKVINPFGLILPRYIGDNRLSSGRHGFNGRNIQVSEDRKSEGAGNRGRTHHKKVGTPLFFIALSSLLDYGRALENAETVLLIDYGKPQIFILHPLRKKRMGADYQIDISLLQFL